MTPEALKIARPPTRCPFCHDQVVVEARGWIACAGCLARHHEACWSEGGACASCGDDAPLVAARRGGEPLTNAPPATRVAALGEGALEADGCAGGAAHLRPLAGSSIRTEAVLGGGTRLLLPAFQGTLGNSPAALVILLGVMALLPGMIGFLILTDEAGLTPLLAALLGFGPGLAVTLRGLLALARPRAVATVELLPDALVFRTVSGVGERPVVHRARREDVGDLNLVNPGPHGTLLADLGAQRVAVAGHPLTAPEQLWLRKAIASWRDGVDA